MIDYVEGEIAELAEEYVVVASNGIGYHIFISRATREDLQSREGLIKIYTHLFVREDELSLYGFSTPEERQLFKLLITVSGVGPKVAMGILSSITPQRFQEAILNERLDILQDIKGIGRKTAERLVLELKDKIVKIPLGLERVAAFSSREEMAFKALTRSLGFSEQEARRAVAQAKATGADSTEELIRKALELLQ